MKSIISQLVEANVASSPLLQFEKWFKDAAVCGLVPEGGQPMTLATATKDGFPSARVSTD